MIRDRSKPVRTVSRTKWAMCPEGTKSWIDGGSSQTGSTSQGRNFLLIRRLNHDAGSSSRKIRILGQAPRPGFAIVVAAAIPRVPRRHAQGVLAASSRPVFLLPTRRDLQRTVFE